MKVYVVVSNNVDEVIGQIDGVFQNFDDAKNCFEDIKEQWLDWADDDVVDTEEEERYFKLETSSETMDVAIISKNLQ